LCTTIGDVSAPPDLVDRAMLLDGFAPATRVDVSTLRAQLEHMRPRLSRALWQAASYAVAHATSTPVPPSIRMVEAARFAASAETLVGFEAGSVVKEFLASRNEAVLINASDPVVTGIVEMMQLRASWTGSLEELLDVLHGPQGSTRNRARSDLPNSARKLRDRLARHYDALSALGVVLDLRETHPTKRTRVVSLSRAEVAAPSASRDEA
jgi:hypothetical protein